MSAAVQWGLIAASMVFVVKVWRRSLSAGAVLSYIPRWPVPWEGIGGAAFVMLLLFLHLAAVLGEHSAIDRIQQEFLELTDAEFIVRCLASCDQLFIVATIMFALWSVTKATFSDFGFGSLRERWQTDVMLGAGAVFFLLGPVYLLYYATALLVKVESQHPVQLFLAESSNPWVYAAAFFSAAIVAPISEELVFRSFFQGWLEKVEDRLLGWRTTRRAASLSDGHVDAADLPETPADNSTVDQLVPDAQPPTTLGFAGLPHGWAPILVSALAFALVHLSNGPDPVPLLLFGVIVGYVYQRTHRLLPCIVCHMLFNAVSLTLAWLDAAS